MFYDILEVVRNGGKFIKTGRNILMGIVLLTSITLTTIVYSAYNTKLQIKGDAVLRSIGDLRITGIKVTSNTNGAYETFNNKYDKYSTTVYVTLPSNGSIAYEVTITNKTNKDYDVSSIKSLNITNSNISALFSLKVGDVVSKNSSKTFTITITNNTSNEQIGTFTYQYSFLEHINSYVVGNYSEQKIYEIDIPYTGEYKVELWGASGGNATGFRANVGGAGGYVSGVKTFTKNDKVYIAVGGRGENSNDFGAAGDGNKRESLGGYNGGGDSQGLGCCWGAGGGGATHFALQPGLLSSLVDRKDSVLMVAAAGGGASRDCNRPIYEGDGGAAGGVTGEAGKTGGNTQCLATGATQTSGGYSYSSSGSTCGNDGTFGGVNERIGADGGGGGSGYYAGATAVCSGGGGGSSYIKKDTFTTEVMLSGLDTIPNYNGGTATIGNIGNGYARITFIKRVFD